MGWVAWERVCDSRVGQGQVGRVGPSSFLVKLGYSKGGGVELCWAGLGRTGVSWFEQSREGLDKEGSRRGVGLHSYYVRLE